MTIDHNQTPAGEEIPQPAPAALASDAPPAPVTAVHALPEHELPTTDLPIDPVPIEGAISQGEPDVPPAVPAVEVASVSDVPAQEESVLAPEILASAATHTPALTEEVSPAFQPTAVEPTVEHAPVVAEPGAEVAPGAEIAAVVEVAHAPVAVDVSEAPSVSEPAPPASATPETSVVNAVPEMAAVAEPTPPERVVHKQSDLDLFEAAMRGDFGAESDQNEGGYKRLSKGDRIEATIIQVDRDKVFVDLGTKAEGIIPLGELSEENLESALGHFNVGDKVNVVVIRPEGAEGNPIVSKRRADFEEIWDRIEAAHKSQEMVTAQVVDRVKGGLVVDVGVRGFVPATHVGSGKLRNIEKYVGQPLQLKVIEIDRERKKVVLSNRQAEEERRASAKDNIFKDVKPGDILEGAVRRLTDYGAFVDLGGVDGLLHISEMSWARITHPKEMFKEGQKIKVMVLRLDQAAGKISLGHRQVLPDPWNLIKQNYTVGQKLTITIGRIVQSGAFIKLPEGAEAFMPVSEMSFRRIKRPQDVVEENQEVECQIIDLRPDERRMVLSMRAIGGGGELKPGATEATSGSYDDEMRRGGAGGTVDRGGGGGAANKKKGAKKGRGGRDADDDFEDVAGRRGFATGGATIGERLGALRGILARDDEDDDAAEVKEEAEAEEV